MGVRLGEGNGPHVEKGLAALVHDLNRPLRRHLQQVFAGGEGDLGREWQAVSKFIQGQRSVYASARLGEGQIIPESRHWVALDAVNDGGEVVSDHLLEVR